VKPTQSLLFTAAIALVAVVPAARPKIDDQVYSQVVASRPAVGDLVFTRIGGPIFTRVAAASNTWTSHVGIIVDYRDGDWVVAESAIPFVRKTPLRRFLERSENQEFSIRRLRSEPTAEEKMAMLRFADSQLGRLYSLGFNLQSRQTFCSRFVHEAVLESTRQSVGEVETFEQLLHRNPTAPLGFWKAWFLGSIPWQRTTITPESELHSPLLRVIVENNV